MTVKLIQDTDASSPDDNSDDAETGSLFLVTTRNRYFEVSNKLVPDISDIPDSIKESHHIYPLNAYIHSGVALSLGTEYPFNDRWDAGQIGFVFVTKDTGDVTSPRESAEGLVEEWNQYLSGDVWGYIVEDEDGQEVDSCWGFYGREYAETEANDALQACIKRRATEDAKIESMMHV